MHSFFIVGGAGGIRFRLQSNRQPTHAPRFALSHDGIMDLLKARANEVCVRIKANFVVTKNTNQTTPQNRNEMRLSTGDEMKNAVVWGALLQSQKQKIFEERA